MVDQPADAQVVVVDDGALGIKNLTHVNGHLSLLIGPGQVPDMADDSADADDHLYLQLALHGVGDLLCHMDQFFAGGALLDLFDEDHVGIVDGDHKVALSVREDGLYGIHHCQIRCSHLPEQEHCPICLGGKMQFLCPDINVAQHDIVGDDVLDKGGLVVLFLIIGLGAVEGNRRHGADQLCLLVLAGDKDSVVKLGAPAAEGLERLAGGHCHFISGAVNGLHNSGPVLPNTGQIIAGNDDTVFVNDANDPICTLLHLKDNTLEHTVGHRFPLFPGVAPSTFTLF